MIKRIGIFVIVISFATAGSGQAIPKWKMTDVVQAFSQKNDTIYVVNFWATFCKPCVEEIPNFIATVKKYEKQKVKLLLVSLDLRSSYPAKIAAFAKKKKYKTNIVWLDETNADYFCPMIDKKWSGVIPATIIVNNKTGFKYFIEEPMDQQAFETALKNAIAASNAVE